jgi:hypothetical protein
MNPNDNGSPDGTTTAGQPFDDTVEGFGPENVREYAQDAIENIQDVVARGRELVLRYPAMSVAGAVAAGWLFARLIARKK